MNAVIRRRTRQPLGLIRTDSSERVKLVVPPATAGAEWGLSACEGIYFFATPTEQRGAFRRRWNPAERGRVCAVVVCTTK